ncbi:MAG: TetR/AcrR family transcriptional regulator [Caulobacter sp.]|nr:TetR/AcrR family transcriptional regulator [Caulobacter sp.]
MLEHEEGLRADARANRDRILEAAREAFAASLDASLNSIAKAAGVGAGTLYRHFPSREALLAGVYRKEIDALAALAPALLHKHPPGEALHRWCERFALAGNVKQGLTGALRAAVSDQEIQDAYQTLVGAVRRLTEACAKAGEASPDASPEDVLVLLSSVLRIPPTPEGKAQAARIIDLVLRALRA